MEATESLFKCLEQVPDPRRARGVRHPFQAILRLTLLGLVCGQTTMAHIALFARMHWPALKEPLGYEFRMRSTPATMWRNSLNEPLRSRSFSTMTVLPLYLSILQSL